MAVGTSLVLLTMPAAFAFPATAAPGDGGQVATAPTLRLADVGADPVVAFYGTQGISSLTIPVPPGLVPASMDVTVEIPVNVAAGTLTATQENRTLSRVGLPMVDRAPISIPLAGAAVVDNAVTVTLRSYLTPTGDYCLDPSNPLRLVDAAVRYEGTEAPPRTVADFLPPILRRLDLFVPETPSRVESDAALRIATAVVARYGKQNTEVSVTALADGQDAPPGPSQPLQRQVVIREGADAGVSLLGTVGVPSLLISGQAGELTNQARLLSSDVNRLALSSKAVVGPVQSSPVLASDSTTLRRLGQPGVNATGLSPQVSLGLDQTRLGRSARNVRVHLQGSYTPLPSQIGGQLVVAIGAETLDSWTADSTGRIDRWIDVPDQLLERYTNLGVTLDISGNVGRCGEFQPITLTIDGDSEIRSERAAPPLPGGFQALPQALMPRVEVGIGEDFADTRRAVAILVGLQRLSGLPVDTAVTSVAEAAASPNPAVLIDAGGWTDDRIALPVAADADGELNIQNAGGAGESGTLTVTPAPAFGSLQTTYAGNRTVLVATSDNAPGELDRLLDWLSADVDRWSRLTGNALIAVPGEPPVTVAAGDGAPDVAAAPAEEGGPGSRWVIGAAVVAVAVLGVGVGLIWLLRKRSRRQP
ncbi:hypothetical protein H7I41_02940 [Mycobacterium manitobense]|uniref:Cellulose biosynthesis cyclic di-GMP-binding regulatory protein BcsB n=2 Tax=[Mycobacterium] manitobense TaxID=190147 RepID=A0A9X2YKJ3_9MYCO|nr:hypothetical protein [[Mycobacterium] manitobense]